MIIETPTLATSRRRATSTKLAWLTAVVAIVGLALGACTPEENQASALLNTSRNENGQKSLPMNIDLYMKAQAWSRQLAGDQKLSHSNLPDGNGYNWSRLGENVGYGYSLEQVQNAFMDSPPHRANILDAGFNRVGVAVTRDDGGRYWVVQEFMQER